MYNVLSFLGIEGRFFVVDSVPSHIQSPPSDELIGVLDRSLVAMGTAVPQTMWTPSAAADRTQLIGEAELQMPIFFEGVDGQLGIPLALAAAGRCDTLIDAQRFAPLGPSQKPVTDICIRVSCIFRSFSEGRESDLNFFKILCSGWDTRSSSSRSQFATKRGSAIPSPLRRLHIT
jgi:hypothetical protein